MKLRLFSFLLSIILCLSMVSFSAFAATGGSCGDGVNWSVSGKTLTISGSGDIFDYSFSDPAPWYDLRSDITTIEIDGGIGTVGQWAFSGLWKVESVIIEDGVERICSFAFSANAALTNVTIPESIATIEYSAFTGCSSLRHVYYGGTPDQWDNIHFTESSVYPESNPELTSASIHYGSDRGPSDASDFAALVLAHNKNRQEMRTNSPMIPDVSDIHPSVVEKSREIVGSETDDYQKLFKIFLWVSENIEYDWDTYHALYSPSYGESSPGYQTAEEILVSRRAMCSGFAELCSELASAQGIPCFAINGHALGDGEEHDWKSQADRNDWVELEDADSNHDWNEAYVNGRWVVFDSTWGEFDYSLEELSEKHLITTKNRYAPSRAFIYTDGGTLIFDKLLGVVSSYEGSGKIVTIPDEVDGLSVSTIEVWVFHNCTAMTGVVLPESITKIRNNAFLNCSSLEDVYFEGTQAQWNAVDIGDGNEDLLNANIHFGTSGPESITQSSPSSWAKAEVDAAIAEGLVPSMTGNPGYQDTITREQFAELAAAAVTRICGKTPGAVSDVTFTDCFNPQVLLAARLGIVNGVGNDRFDPTAATNREQIATMIYRAAQCILNETGVDLVPVSASIETFPDKEKVSSWAVEAVGALAANNIMNGTATENGTVLAPQNSCTVEQSILLMYRLYKEYVG